MYDITMAQPLGSSSNDLFHRVLSIHMMEIAEWIPKCELKRYMFHCIYWLYISYIFKLAWATKAGETVCASSNTETHSSGGT